MGTRTLLTERRRREGVPRNPKYDLVQRPADPKVLQVLTPFNVPRGIKDMEILEPRSSYERNKTLKQDPPKRVFMGPLSRSFALGFGFNGSL